MSPRFVLVALIALSFPSFALAQRYDLGQRLRMMERSWETATPANRTRSVEPLKKAVANFFTGKAPEAAAALDSARFLLQGGEAPSPDVRWANSLVVRPASRIVDPADGRLGVVVAAYYDSKAPMPDGAAVRFTVSRDGAEIVLGEWAIEKLPSAGTLAIDKLGTGDFRVSAEILVNGQSAARMPFLVSAIPDWKNRLASLRPSGANSAEEPTTRRQSLAALRTTLGNIGEGYEFETDVPAARLLSDAELLSKPDGDKSLLAPGRGGEFWLTLATASGAAPVRLFVPPNLKAGQPVPLVVAMHGAGGSENLFFDGYGDGVTVRQCQDKGWMMVATRAGGFLSTRPPVAEMIDELSKYYPIDPKHIFVVGHSMGAAHAIATAQASPGRVSAVAALGGGGNVKTPSALKGLPVFVGCGVQDFALGGAKALVRSLEKAGANVQYREYPDIEHLVIVQAAIRDVIAFFDQSRKPPADQ